MSAVRTVSLLGSTGSIGASTLDVLARHPDRFRIAALGAREDWRRMLEQCRAFRPARAGLAQPEAARRLRAALREEGLATEVVEGEQGLVDLARAPEADTVLAAIVGAAGLAPALAAARAGKRLLLANKEALVLSGALFMEAVRSGGATLLPIDSEHNAIFQCLPDGAACGRPAPGVRRVLLTASGGPFRTVPIESLAAVTPDEACAHPNWVMGRKISVDSATMMNKGLEVIEAHWLFALEPSRIEVLIHPQSIVHSLVEYEDGSLLAQMSNPDMRTPIAHALAWPERVEAGVRPLDLALLGRLDFEQPDARRFPCLGLAFGALRAGGSAPAVLNAANEVAVAAFLEGRAGFLDIARACAHALERVEDGSAGTLEEVLEADRRARAVAAAFVERAGADRRGQRR